MAKTKDNKEKSSKSKAGKKSAKTVAKTAEKVTGASSAKKGDAPLRLPAKGLNAWVDERMGWSDADWNALLAQLREDGHGALLDSSDGIDRIKDHVTKRFQKGLKLPKKALNAWVKTRPRWSHDEWLGLLGELSEKGYDDLTTSEKGRNAIGQYIEAKANEAEQASMVSVS